MRENGVSCPESLGQSKLGIFTVRMFRQFWLAPFDTTKLMTSAEYWLYRGPCSRYGRMKTSQFDPEVIIVESLRRVLVGSENEAKDVGAFWRNVQPILTAGKTMIISHHMRKPNALGNNAPRDRASGSTDILAGADAGFSVQRLSKDAVVIECVKLREAEETEPFVVSLSEQEVGGPVEMCFEGSKKEFDDFGTKVEKAMSLAKTFLAALPARTAKTGDIIAHLKAHGVAEKTSERALAQLRKLGGVQKVGHGVWQSVSQQQAA